MNKKEKIFKGIGFIRNSYSHQKQSIYLLESATHKAQNLPFPPERIMQYGETKQRHLASGRKDYNSLVRVFDENNVNWNDINKVYEFGCGNSRVLRHFQGFHKKKKGREIWGSDINSNTLSWSLANLSPPFNFFVNTTQPHIPMPDGYFDLIYAYSIFTHIDDLFFTWILELRRVIADSKYLYISIHDENSVRFAREKRPTGGIGKIVTEHKGLMDNLLDGKIDFLCVRKGETGIQTFSRRQFILDKLSQWFHVLAVEEYTMGGHQTALLLQKK